MILATSRLIIQRWVQKEARPISLRQLTFFGRTLTENRLISSANYVRTELPTRLAHRLRDMQTLPFAVVTNPHMSHVYDLYYRAFERLRRVREIKCVEDNEKYCKVISETLQEHLTVIPRLAMGVLECQGLMRPQEIDKFMNTLLRSVRLACEDRNHSADLNAAYFSPCHCRTTSCADRDLQRPMAFPKCQSSHGPECRVRGRSLPTMQRARGSGCMLAPGQVPG